MAELKHKGLTDQIIREFYNVYNELGSGFLESVYEKALAIALHEAGLSARKQVPIDVWFRGQKVGDFRADIVVAETVLLELKAVNNLDAQHEAQLLNYLRATNIEIGFVMNFGPKPQFKRKIFVNAEKRASKPLLKNKSVLIRFIRGKGVHSETSCFRRARN